MKQALLRGTPALSWRVPGRTRTGKMTPTQQAHAGSVQGKFFFLGALLLLLIISASFIITLGQVPMTVRQVCLTLVERLTPSGVAMDPLIAHVVWHIRMPLITGTVMCGVGLGVCGCVMQAVLKNPMASPFTLGISSGAHFGVSLAAVFGISFLDGPYFLVGNAFVCAALCSGFIIALSALRGATSETLILAGIAVNYLFQAANQLFTYIADDEQRTIMSYWGMGSLSDLNWHSLGFLGVICLVCLPFLYRNAWDLNLMTTGDDCAKSMGVDANAVRMAVMVVASLLVAAIVAFTGVIGFVGLVAPHIARIIIGNDHRFLIPASGGIGGALLLIANAVSMNILGGVVIPVGIIMSMLGIPLFLYLIIRGKRREFWA
jgi:iron complex transport system permease protein